MGGGKWLSLVKLTIIIVYNGIIVIVSKFRARHSYTRKQFIAFYDGLTEWKRSPIGAAVAGVCRSPPRPPHTLTKPRPRTVSFLRPGKMTWAVHTGMDYGR